MVWMVEVLLVVIFLAFVEQVSLPYTKVIHHVTLKSDWGKD